ncbi:MAG TPA: cupin domain-containing protein, partial [Thermomicrobiales bacterium]
MQEAILGQPTRATDDLVVIAPDGIAVHPIPLPGLFGLSIAEGRLPIGEFGVHAHRSLEQITYVLSGQLLVTMGDPTTGETIELPCGPGDTIGTAPLVTLSYRNAGPEPVRVLFICAPPYPADDADTATFEGHRALTGAELAVVATRVDQTRAAMNAQFDALGAR